MPNRSRPIRSMAPTRRKPRPMRSGSSSAVSTSSGKPDQQKVQWIFCPANAAVVPGAAGTTRPGQTPSSNVKRLRRSPEPFFMRGKTIVITGATSGIGAVAAMRLAEQGARILFTARDGARAEAALARLHKVNDTSAHQYFLGDLSLLADQKRLAGEIAAAAPAIDVLINNAGALFNRRIETADGLEKTFALNHMSYFTLTRLLLPQIAPGGRIVNVASRAHRNARLDFGDLQSRRGYVGFLVYSRSKLCNI